MASEAFAGCSAVETAWAAGLFEGEGSLSWSRDRRGLRYPTAALGMTDFDVVEKFSRMAGVGRLYTYAARSERHKDQRHWSVSGAAAVDVARVLLPHFGERRGGRARELIDWYVETYLRECAECGDPYIAKRRSQLYCSKECNDRVHWRVVNQRRREATERSRRWCVVCGVEVSWRNTYCSEHAREARLRVYREYRARKKAAV